MKIEGKPPVNVGSIYHSRQSNAASGKNINIPGSDSDRVEISEQARKISELVKKAVQLPEVRQEKVAAIKEKIADGSYKVSAHELASKMLQEK